MVIERVCNRPLIERWHEFASADECKMLIEGTSEYVESLAFIFGDNQNRKDDHRICSTGIDRERKLDLLRKRCFERLVNRLPSLELDHIEPVQITRYEPGHYYKPHWDFFNNIGNNYTIENDRRATMIVYLNDNFEGGSTKFTHLPVDQAPTVGLGLFWQYNYDAPTNKLTMHSGEPVVSGVKYIAQMFIRNSRWPDGTKVPGETTVKPE